MDYIDVVQASLSGRCGLSCPMCGQPKADRDMPPGIVAALRDGLAAFPRPPILALAVRGEPTAHPDFPGAVRALAGLCGALPRPPFRELYLDTNAQGLDAAAADALLDVAAAGPFVRLTVSTDAATPETYAAVRRGGSYDLLLHNVETFLARRAARGLARPAVNFQFIVMEANEGEAEAFAGRFAALLDRFGSAPRLSGKYPEHDGDALSFVFHHPLDPSPESLAREEARHRRVLARLGAAPPPTTAREASDCCVWPFYMCVVRENGDLLPCCLDTRDELVLGSLARGPLASILAGPAMTALRLAHARDRDALPARCRRCPDQLVVERPGEKIARFLAARGRGGGR